MTAHEIKHGNYLALNNEIVRVMSVVPAGVEVELHSGEIQLFKPGDLQPVELGSELLEDNCLFDKNGKHYIRIDHHRYCLELINGYIVLANKDHEPVIHFWDVRYLHQFQNLYYSLMGKELELTFSCRLF